MNTGKNLVDLSKELMRQQESKKDFRAPTGKLEMVVRNGGTNPSRPVITLGNGHGEYGLTDLAAQQLGQWAGIPSKYWDRMETKDADDLALLAHNVNHWLKKQNETRLIRALDGNIRAFLSNKYRTIDNYDVASAVIPKFQELDAKVVSANVTESRLYFKAVLEGLSFEPRKGDVVRFGAVVSNSEVGLGAVKIEPFLERLICLNGAIVAESAVRKFHIGRHNEEADFTYEILRDETRALDDKAFFAKLQDATSAAFAEQRMRSVAEAVVEGVERKIEAPLEEVIEVTAKRYGFTEQDGSSILKHLAGGSDLSQYGFANAITRHANDVESYEKSTALERAGGEVMVMNGSAWEELAGN